MTISNFFVPNRQIVSSISNANPGVVTTTQPHGYESGLCIRFYFPLDVGMNTLDNQEFRITVLSDTTFSIPIDTTKFDAFSVGSSNQSPQIIPIAEQASSLNQALDNNENIVPEF